MIIFSKDVFKLIEKSLYKRCKDPEKNWFRKDLHVIVHMVVGLETKFKVCEESRCQMYRGMVGGPRNDVLWRELEARVSCADPTFCVHQRSNRATDISWVAWHGSFVRKCTCFRDIDIRGFEKECNKMVIWLLTNPRWNSLAKSDCTQMAFPIR
jgi:hypothetical protein